MCRPWVLVLKRRTTLLSMMGGGVLLLVSTVLSGQSVPLIDPLTVTASLKTVPVPAPPPGDFAKLIVDPTPGSASMIALVQLGKALFWDQQVGSDGQACASCHFHAGADNRTKNQLNPGFRTTLAPATIAFSTGFGPNYQLKQSDFPFHKVSAGVVVSDSTNIVSSQGVFNATFTGLGLPPSSIDLGIGSFVAGLPGAGNFFTVSLDGSTTNLAAVRNVEPRNTPTAINAVFNHRNFWDGRGRNEFNGVDPIGQLDPFAQIIKNGAGGPTFQTLQLQNSSAASQAVGPPGSNLEMSFAGRVTDAEQMALIGRKLLSLTPLALQTVAPNDSVLSGLLAVPGPTGLNTTYASLIQTAFNRVYWDGTANNPNNRWIFQLTGLTPPAVARQPIKVPATLPHSSLSNTQFELIEANFSLFFGLAIQEYERTLIANDSRFDKHMEALQYQRDGIVPAGFNMVFNPGQTTLTVQEQQGLQVFLGTGRCINCHSGPELTAASVGNVQNQELLERMIMGDDKIAVYDNGFYNTAVRNTPEDLGVGATIGPLNLPLSNTLFFQQAVQNRVQQLVAAGISRDAAIRQANNDANVPRILARPEEAQKLLSKAGPSTIPLLQGILNGLQSAVGMLAPTDPNQAQGNLLLTEAQTQLTKAGTLFTPVKPTLLPDPDGAAAKLIIVYTKLAKTALLVPAPAQTAAQTQLMLVPGSVLLPDLFKPAGNFGPPLQPDERAAVMGSFKTPTIRNVELTAPFFHDGGASTLEQVVDFYNRGGNFPDANRHDLDVDIQPLGLTPQDQAALVAFMKACTDERVRYEKAPFDHPSLSVPNGGGSFTISTAAITLANVLGIQILDDRQAIPAVGAGGLAAPPLNFFDLLAPL